MAEPTETFAALRPVLLGVAYRLLGSMADAEDVVQDGYVRWAAVDPATVREPRAYLITIVSRLALDQLRSARARHETYPGVWLPEPVATDALGPADTAELKDTMAYATVHLMRRLTPPERAAYVLRTAFDLPYDDIARVVDATPAACRQLVHRAQARLDTGRDRFAAAPAETDRLLSKLMHAAGTGRLEELADLLAAEVTVWSDGGGRARAALRPVHGRARVLRFLAGLVERYGVGEVSRVDVNGGSALRIASDAGEQALLVGLRDGRVADVFIVRNPDKLLRLGCAELRRTGQGGWRRPW